MLTCAHELDAIAIVDYYQLSYLVEEEAQIFSPSSSM
jgi:hypothetical protein